MELCWHRWCLHHRNIEFRWLLQFPRGEGELVPFLQEDGPMRNVFLGQLGNRADDNEASVSHFSEYS